MTALIECQGIRKIYGEGAGAVEALRGIDFSIGKGENVAIVGPSGSGKSTLLQILGCLDLPSFGTYRLNQVNVCSLSDDDLSELRGKQIGFVFQAFHLFPGLNLVENVALPLNYLGTPKNQRAELAVAALAKVKLSHRIHHKPNELSGGEKQRAAIARAIVHQPPLILADEPTGNLDSAVKAEILDYLCSLNESMGVTLVTVTHDAETAARARRVIKIKDGRIDGDERQ